jgi:uracil-DNA glycosylase
LLASYHPSQRNTQTGLLNTAMFSGIFERARHLIGGAAQQH